MGRRKLISSKEAAILLGIATDEDNLIRHFTLDPADRLECELRRRPQNKLGFAVQLCTMRQTGRLLWDNEQPPAAVINYLADQLGIDARLPYAVEQAVAALAEFEVAICVGGHQPVAFFAYPGKPGRLLPQGCEVIELAGHEHDLAATLKALAGEVGAGSGAPFASGRLTQRDIPAPVGPLNAETVSIAVARALPENAIVCDESVTSGGRLAALAPGLPPHDHLMLTGGAIGIGIPLAAGAAIACPDRKVVALQADGSGMYTVQGLWTQAREHLDVVTVVLANRAYAILQGEMRNVGVNRFGRNASRMLGLDDPALDWCALATGMGVEAGRAATVEEFTALLDAALSRRGPFLIEALI